MITRLTIPSIKGRNNYRSPAGPPQRGGGHQDFAKISAPCKDSNTTRDHWHGFGVGGVESADAVM